MDNPTCTDCGQPTTFRNHDRGCWGMTFMRFNCTDAACGHVSLAEMDNADADAIIFAE